MRILKTVVIVGVLAILYSSCTKKDDSPPYIRLRGGADTTIALNAVFHDPGASAKDNFDDRVPVTTSGVVNSDSIGVYTLTYSAVDEAGNSASISRTVHVQNSISSFKGEYNVVRRRYLKDTTFYSTEAVEFSNTVNNRIIFPNFSGYINSRIFVDLAEKDSLINFPNQTIKYTQNSIREREFYASVYDKDSSYIRNGVIRLKYTVQTIDTFGVYSDTTFSATYTKIK